ALNGHRRVASFLLERGARKDFLPAVALGDCEYISGRLKADPSLIDQQDESYYYPLHVAVRLSNSEMVKLLLKHKADVNYSHFGTTALHLAAEMGKSDVMKVLLAEGAKADAADEHGFTSLHFAIRNKHPVAAKLLLESTAKVNVKDKRGASPL